uniref:Helicase ATP-binding domain-containing protein n=1 Tax=viral metagenome TaxID=1070528 RepID=A0A6C0D5X7_9ZZZZ
MATNKELLDLWLKETNLEARERLLETLGARNLVPKNEDDYEEIYGLYPDIEDEDFLVKLFHKREFAENKLNPFKNSSQELASCGNKVEFELSPIQRFVSNFMSGKTPYHSALLYHGVGVGKTAAAISIAEANLYLNPKKKVYLIAPPNIQPNFMRTIFDINAVSISNDVNVPNKHNGATGNLYLQLTGTEFEKDKKIIEKKVKKIIDTRYEFMGYIQLASFIESTVAKVSPIIKNKKLEEIKVIKKEFSGKCMIIDEAHNLRDVPGEKEEENLDAPGGITELSDMAQGKKLTPSLMRVLKNSMDMKLVLLTATPMYNNYLEMIFLLNLLLMNDKKAEIKPLDIFNVDGTFKSRGDQLLGRFITPYVSYMRGETPLTFPTRLEPTNTPFLKIWPNASPDNKALNLSDTERERVLRLPLIPVAFGKENYANYIRILNESVGSYGLGVSSIDTMIQSGNWIYPSSYQDEDLEQRIRDSGFDNVFDERSHSLAGLRRFSSKIGRPTWLLEDNLANYSPKANYIIKRIKNAEGPIFIYSRFIKSGALPLALALEANGYTPFGRDKSLLVEGNIAEGGRQCALCRFKEREHRESDHTFVPAKYVLLTGRKDISPNNNFAVSSERAFDNYNGSQIKVVIGSQVASEGIDFKFIREIYVFDSWFHLNKMEQVLGRGIRTCSHAHPNIPFAKRNCTVYLMVNSLNESRESADLYMYRIGMTKALQIGRISRVVKRYAIDCNLNKEGNMITNMEARLQINAQNDPPEGELVDINDKNYTNLCDWAECEYTCAVEPLDIDIKGASTLTYDDYTSRWRESQVKRAIKKTFEDKQVPFLQLEDIQNILTEIPKESLFSILYDIVDNKSFRLVLNNKEGYLIYKNGYYVFQPFALQDLEIPLALRIKNYPVKTDVFIPVKEEVLPKAEEISETKREEEEKVISNDMILKFWQTFVNMAKKIEKGILESKPSDSVVNAIKEKYKMNDNLIKNSIERLEMIYWFYETIKTKEEDRSLFAEIVLEYIWDNFILPMEQYKLIKTMDELIAKVAREQLVKDKRYFRYVEFKTPPFDIKYICKDGKPCFPAIVKDLETDQKDTYNTLKVNKENTGNFYGFLVPMKEILMFKSNKSPPSVGKEPEKGEACHNITTLAHHLNYMYPLGKVLKERYNYEYDINEEIMDPKDGKRKFKSAPRYCSLRELVLRFMDIKKVNNLRWFYRPISAIKTNHLVVTKKK